MQGGIARKAGEQTAILGFEMAFVKALQQLCAARCASCRGSPAAMLLLELLVIVLPAAVHAASLHAEQMAGRCGCKGGVPWHSSSLRAQPG